MSNKYFTTFLFILILPLYISAQDIPFNLALGDTGWFQQNSGTTRHLYDVCFVNDTTGLAISQGGIIIKTTNGGETWQEVFNDGSKFFSSIFFVNEDTGWVSENWGIIQKTTNGGITWSEINHSLPVSMYDIFFLDSQKGWIIGKKDFGGSTADSARIFVTFNGGNTWHFQYGDTLVSNLLNVFFVDNLNGWAVGYYERGGDAIILHTTNAGNPWYIQNDDFTGGLSDVYFVDDTTGWAVGPYGRIVNTTDAGATWNSQNSGTSANLESVFFTSNYQGWIVGNEPEGRILKTTNAGETWYNQYATVPFSATTVKFLDDYYGWIAGFNGIILHTDTGGEYIFVDPYNRTNLNKSIEDFQTTEDYITITSIDKANQSLTLIDVEVLIDEVWHTSDSDLEFTLTHNGVSETIIYQAGGSGDNFIGTKLTDNAVTHISDGAAPFSGNYKPENPLSPFVGINPTGTWTLSIYDGAAGNTGTLQAWGLVLIYSPIVGVEDESNVNPDQFQLYQNYPNPFNPSTKIKFTVSQSPLLGGDGRGGLVTLKVYDILGNEVSTLVSEELTAGEYEVELNAGQESVPSLTSGVYFYQLKAGSFIQTKKMLLLK